MNNPYKYVDPTGEASTKGKAFYSAIEGPGGGSGGIGGGTPTTANAIGGLAKGIRWIFNIRLTKFQWKPSHTYHDANYRIKIKPFTVKYNANKISANKVAIDTHKFTSGTVTKNGGIRNNRQFWKAWKSAFPKSLSKANLAQIKKGRSPSIDDVWIKAFPEHRQYKGELLIHHHIDFGRYAIPVPGGQHRGSGGVWHY